MDGCRLAAAAQERTRELGADDAVESGHNLDDVMHRQISADGHRKERSDPTAAGDARVPIDASRGGQCYGLTPLTMGATLERRFGPPLEAEVEVVRLVAKIRVGWSGALVRWK
jgi:hypothetical protein